jgi:hypothetical protein
MIHPVITSRAALRDRRILLQEAVGRFHDRIMTGSPDAGRPSLPANCCHRKRGGHQAVRRHSCAWLQPEPDRHAVLGFTQRANACIDPVKRGGHFSVTAFCKDADARICDDEFIRVDPVKANLCGHHDRPQRHGVLASLNFPTMTTRRIASRDELK